MKKITLFAVAYLFGILPVLAQQATPLDRSVAPLAQPNPEIKINIPEIVLLENGIKLIVVENHKLPRISFQFYVDYPVETERHKTGLSEIFGEMLGAGTSTRTKDEIDAKVDYMGATLFTHQNGFYASSLKKHTPTLLELLSEVVKTPAFPESELDRIIKQQVSGLENIKSDPTAMAANVSAVVNYGKSHPYGEVTTEKTLDMISIEDIREYYKRLFIPNLTYLVIVGDVTPKEGLEMASKYFGDWKAGNGPKPSIFSVAPSTGNHVYFVDKPEAVQSVVALTHTVELKPGHPDEIKLSVLNRILGGGGFTSRLFANLREEKAYTYGCYSSLSSNRIVGEFSAGGSFRNEVTDSAITEILNEIKTIFNEPVKAEELEMAKKVMTGEFARSLESPQTVASFALSMAMNKLPADYYTNYLKRLEAITIADLSAVAKKYLRPENLNIVVVGNSEIEEKLIAFDANHEITHKDYYGEDKSPLKPVPQGITAQMVIDNFTLRSFSCTSVTDIPAKLKKIGYVQITSTASGSVQGITFSIEMNQFRAKTNKTAMQLKIVTPMGPQIARKEWFDGEKGGSFTMGGAGIETYEGEDLEVMKHPSFPFTQMHYFTNKSLEVKLLGIEELEGKEYYKVKVSRQGHNELVYEYYSLETKMLTMTETITKDPEGNVSSAFVTYGDYRDVKGLLLPFTMEMNMAGQSVKFTSTEVIVKKKGKTNAFIGDFSE